MAAFPARSSRLKEMINWPVDVLKQSHLLLGGHVVIASLGALARRDTPYGELTVHVELLKDILLAHTHKVFAREQTRSACSEYLCGRYGGRGARVENEGGHSESLDHLGATGEELGLGCHLAVNHTTGERPHVLGVNLTVICPLSGRGLVLPVIVNDNVSRVGGGVPRGSHEAFVDIDPLISRASCYCISHFGLEEHQLAQGVRFSICHFSSCCCGLNG